MRVRLKGDWDEDMNDGIHGQCPNCEGKAFWSNAVWNCETCGEVTDDGAVLKEDEESEEEE